MLPRELLGVFVRLAGLGLILFAVFDLYYVIVKLVGLPTSSNIPVGRDVQGLITYLGLGVVVLFGARWIVRLAYWRDDS